MSRRFRVGKHSKSAAGNGFLVLAPLMHTERRVGVRGWCWVGLVEGYRLWQVLLIISPCPICSYRKLSNNRNQRDARCIEHSCAFV